MSSGASANSTTCASGVIGAIFRLALLALLLVGGVRVLPVAAAETTPAPAEGTAATPVQVQELLKLLADPAVQGWIAKHEAAPPSSEPAATSSGASSDMAGMGGAMGLQEQMGNRLSGIRDHLQGVVAAVPRLPADFGRAHAIIMDSLSGSGLGRIVMLVALFVGMGFLVEWIFWRTSAGLRTRIINASVTSVRDRLIATVMRLGFGVTWVLAFAIGSVGAFLLFPWPPLLRELVLGYLMVFLVIRMAYVGHPLRLLAWRRALPSGPDERRARPHVDTGPPALRGLVRLRMVHDRRARPPGLPDRRLVASSPTRWGLSCSASPFG